MNASIPKYGFCLSVVLAALLLVSTAAARAPIPVDRPPFDSLQDRPLGIPQPVTIDQVTHNKGNIVTTVDNWGYIGGYSYYGLPSGEWPRNSGHDYLAEIRYWIGAVTPAVETLVANSYDDFEAIPAQLSAAPDPYAIFLSTDTTRYYLPYDQSDTVGSGVGTPARGWRIWDDSLQSWVYNQVYDPLTDSMVAGGPTSLQESFYRFGDYANVPAGDTLLGLEMTHRVLQWNYCYNEDFLFVILEITNRSTQDYPNLAFGLYVDIDVGGPDGTGENGRLEDLVAFDSLENLAWIYDNKGWDPGWGRDVPTGIMGTKLLETPDNIGMTAFRTDDWAFMPDDDAGRFALINSQQFDVSLPPTDQFYIQCVRGISLTAGKTVRVVYALVAGQDESEFRDNASRAQQLYDNFFVGPQPPPTPRLRARAGDHKVYLFWDDTSEVSADPLSGVNDFVGYKLYRSDNQGKTWGVTNYNTGNACLTVDYATLATYAVSSPGDPIPHSYIDTGLYNGVDYWYCLVAFDAGDTIIRIDPLQSGFGIAGETPNVVSARPTDDPAGYYDAAGTVSHNYVGTELPSEGEVVPIVFDEGALLGSDYQVVFEDAPDQTYWHLINVTTGDTVLANQTKTNADPDLYDIAEGLRVVVNDGDHLPRGYGQTAFGGTDTTLAVATFYGPSLPAFTGDVNDVFGNAHFRSTFEIRYTGDSSRGSWVLDGFYGTDIPYWVPFEIWNTSTNERVSVAVYDWGSDGGYDPDDLLTVVNYPYDSLASVTPFAFPYYYRWMFGFDDSVFNPVVGDVFTVQGAPLNGPGDNFAFKVDGINSANARKDLKDIRVVPNPYFARYSAMVETAEGQSVLEFQKIPDRCTIRIYTLAGDLVCTIEHDGSGAARWDLLSESGRQVASGVYIFHVDSPYGEHLGRFAVIK
ncbi:MAG: hypothetical protein AB1744_01210 [Candidatus Zixiibacteriota bacterium]